ncbi:hypothetical protein EMCRGX_G023177 [Ephydatia muelleri]
MGWKLQRPQVTRRLLKIYVAIFLSSFSNAYVIAMLYPFLPFMVGFLLPNIDEASISKYAGIVATAFYIGRLVGSYVWGGIADCIGRKPVLIMCGVMLILTSVLFGFSINFVMCVLARFLMGLCCGILVVVRAVISESSSDSNQAFGLSILTFSWLLAVVMSSALSGVTADPIGQYNLTLSNGTLKTFLTDYPYAPPCLISCLVLMVGVFSVILLLPETLNRHKPQTACEDDSAASAFLPSTTSDVPLEMKACVTSSNEIADSGMHETAEQQPGVPADNETRNSDAHSDDRMQNPSMAGHEVTFIKWKSAIHNGSKKLMADLKYIICNKATMLATVSHCILAANDVGLDTLYALWCATSVTMGGLGFTVKDIGVSSSISAALLTPFSLVAYPLLEKKIGSINTCQMSVIILMFCTILFPNIHHLTLVSDLDPAVLWTVLILTRLVSIVFLETCFAAQCLLINNSVTSDKFGSVNGIAVSLSDIFRAAFLAATGVIYSVSLSKETSAIGFPFDYNITFILYGACLLIITFLTACLPSSVNHKKL